jgi:hypothetical protein
MGIRGAEIPAADFEDTGLNRFFFLPLNHKPDMNGDEKNCCFSFDLPFGTQRRANILTCPLEH